MRNKLTILGLLCGVSGFLGIAVIWMTGASAPERLFQIGAPVSLLLLAAALLLLSAAWILTIWKELQEKHYFLAALWAFSGLLLILLELRRIL